MMPQTEREWLQALAAAHPDRGGDPLVFQQVHEARAEWRKRNRACGWCGGPLPNISRTGHKLKPLKYCSIHCSSLSAAERRTVRHRRIGVTSSGQDVRSSVAFPRGFRMKSAVLGLVVLLVSVSTASAQTNPCQSPVSDVAIAPSLVYLELTDYAGTLPTGQPMWDEVVVGDFLPGVNPATGGQPLQTTVIPRASLQPVAGSPNCFVAALAFAARPTTLHVSHARTRRTSTSPDMSAWSAASNPFAWLAALPAPAAVRRIP